MFTRTPKLDALTGRVAHVEVFAETKVSEEDGGLRTLNKMRIALQRSPNEPPESFTFTNSSVMCREGDHVTLVRASYSGGEPTVAALRNHTTGQAEEMRAAFRALGAPKGLAARWRALAYALLIGLVYWSVTALTEPPGSRPVSALLLALLAFPALWTLAASYDSFALPRRRQKNEGLLREMIEDLFVREGGVRPAPAPNPPAMDLDPL